MQRIADDPLIAEVICNHEGGGPSWAKNVEPQETMERYRAEVHWMQANARKSQSGNPELTLNEYGHFAQVVIWLLNSFQTPPALQKFDGNEFTAHCMVGMSLAVQCTLDLATRHANQDIEPELPLTPE